MFEAHKLDRVPPAALVVAIIVAINSFVVSAGKLDSVGNLIPDAFLEKSRMGDWLGRLDRNAVRLVTGLGADERADLEIGAVEDRGRGFEARSADSVQEIVSLELAHASDLVYEGVGIAEHGLVREGWRDGRHRQLLRAERLVSRPVRVKERLLCCLCGWQCCL